MNKIIFTGYYGMRNLGDDSFGLISIYGANKYWNIPVSFLLSKNGPKITDGNMYLLKGGVKYFNSTFVETFFKVSKNSFVIFSGGSIFYKKPNFLSVKNIINFKNKIGSIKIGAIGVSLGPFNSVKDENETAQFLNNFKFIAVRDTDSFLIAKQINIKNEIIHASDLAYLLTEKYEIKHKFKFDNSILGITVCYYERYVNGDIEKEKKRISKLKQLIKKLKKIISL